MTEIMETLATLSLLVFVVEPENQADHRPAEEHQAGDPDATGRGIGQARQIHN